MGNMPKGYGSLVDQLKRESWSIPLDIGEGRGKSSDVDKQRFHSIARGSAMECGAILDVCHALQVVDTSRYQEGKNLLVRIAAMLTKMCLRSE
jgi:four helix bundle protein